MRGLQYITDITVQPQLGPLSGVPAVDQDLSFSRLIKTADQIDQRGFAGAGLPDNGYAGSLPDHKIEMLQHQFFPVRIPEGHITKLHIAPERFPVLPAGIVAVTVFFNHFRAVNDIRLRHQQIMQPLYIRLGHGHLGKHIDHGLDRIHQPQGIRHEYGQSTDPHQPLHAQQTAPPQDHGQSCRRHQGNNGSKQRGIVGRADRQLSHMSSILTELPNPDIFNGQRPYLGRSCQSFIKAAGNQGVLLPDPSVEAYQPAGEKADQQSRRRHQNQDRQRQSGMDHQHDCRRTDEIGRAPHEDHQLPADHLPDLRSVTHCSGQHIADTVVVEIAKRQRLDMVKGTVAHIPGNGSLNIKTHVKAHIVSDRLQCQQDHIQKDKYRESPQALLRNEMIEGIAVEKGKDCISQRTEEAQ